MPHSMARFIPLVVAFTMVGCNHNPQAAPDTREADAKAIRDADSALVKHANARNLEGVVDIYADNASLMITNLPSANGKDAIRRPWKQFLADQNFALICTPIKVEVSKAGDYGYAQGAYTFNMTDAKTKKPAKEIGKYVMVFKKQADGAWKIVAEIFNADAPAAPA